ncbi:MAG: hypothetical protein EBZ48_14040, partial [Proteobacteria bacterium]|nr:hypothetical protein [Pseudomonadota bacterium]
MAAALVAAALVLRCSAAGAEAPLPYSASVKSSPRDATVTLLDSTRDSAASDMVPDTTTASVAIPTQRWVVRIRELGILHFTFQQKREQTWRAYQLGAYQLQEVPLGRTTALRGKVAARRGGRFVSYPATAMVSAPQAASHSAVHQVATTTIRFALPRRSGKRSFYQLTLRGPAKPKLARVPALATANRSCGTISSDFAGPAGTAKGLIKHSGASSSPITQPSVTYREVKIAAIADYDYFTASGANQATVANRIAALMNDVSAIYERDLGITITLSNIYIYSSPSTPFTTSDAELLLNQVANNVATYGSADIYHLLTGRNVYGLIGGIPNFSVVGLAYVAEVCTVSGYPYSLSEKFSDTLDHVTIAHELGHNFGANHDQFHTSPSTIMFPALPVSQIKFSDFSRGEILDN